MGWGEGEYRLDVTFEGSESGVCECDEGIQSR